MAQSGSDSAASAAKPPGLRTAVARVADIAGAATVAGVGAVCGLVAGISRRVRRRQHPKARRLLTFDATYSLGLIRERKLEHEITCRDLNGFFDHVWSVHPMVGASPEEVRGHWFTRTEVADRHTMIEGSIAYSARLEELPVLNFLLAQVVLLFRLDRLIREQGVCVLRAGEPFYLGLIGLILARVNQLPLVVRINANFDLLHAEAQGACYPRLYRWRSLERAVGRFVLSRADLVAPGSDDNLRYAVANGAGPERTTIWRYGMWIDPLHFSVEPEDRPSVRKELGLEEQPFFILVSRLAAIKHPEDAVRVLAAAKQREPRMAAVLVGGGIMQGEVEDLARELGVHDDLHVLGYRDQPWLASALSSADVVISTLTGRALVEACLSGTPVVAYDVEWQSELIRPDETGILVPYRDAGAMAEAVCRVVREPELGLRLGRRARAFTAEIMDPQSLLLRETADYERLLGCGVLTPDRRGDPRCVA